MRRPVIGVATQTLPAIPGERPHCWVMGFRYIEALRASGALPWVIPLIPSDPETMEGIFERLDGVFLTGGVDVDPGRYGEPKSQFCGLTDPDRDAVELMLLHHATRRNLPVLAVCRGIQIINVAMGGTLYQDVSAQVPATMKHDYFPTLVSPSRAYLAHDVLIETGTRLGDIVGRGPAPVNSMHHQAIKTLAAGLRATAHAPDGVIEAIEATDDRYMVAVQWHPEELTETQAGMKRLFDSFISAAVAS